MGDCTVCLWRAEKPPEIEGEVDQWDRFYSDLESLLDLLRLEVVSPLLERGEVELDIIGYGSRTNSMGDYVQVPNKIMRRMAECGVDFTFDVWGRDDND